MAGKNEKKMVDEDLYHDEDECFDDCPKCGRTYNEIDHEYQICSKCGWDAEKEVWEKASEPSQMDYENGDADILTGRWY